MSNASDNELKNREFWSRMAKNSLVVQRMPAWMKGSPVNKRTQLPAKLTESRMVRKSASAPNR
jgi:hypothetical protein